MSFTKWMDRNWPWGFGVGMFALGLLIGIITHRCTPCQERHWMPTGEFMKKWSLEHDSDWVMFRGKQ